jgi:hypothetical protein
MNRQPYGTSSGYTEKKHMCKVVRRKNEQQCRQLVRIHPITFLIRTPQLAFRYVPLNDARVYQNRGHSRVQCI